ncbi:MAG: hypothetical protein ABII00_04385 [Elusimicrobiota bacterium]
MLGGLRAIARAARRAIAGGRGQIAIPSLFVLPTLFLFVYLSFETAKISREKIRHQFALDAAAFIEMTNYSDFLNRSAYVNGAFPQRIFYEGFYNTCIEKKNNTSGDCGGKGDRLYTILFKNGAFPKTDQAPPDAPLDSYPRWFLRFGGTGQSKNNNAPDMGGGRLDLLTMQDALDYWLSWDDAQDIYKLYVQIYQLLGSVEDAQYSVFKRLTNGHNFFRKSYWLNTNDSIGAAFEGAAYFDAYSFSPKPYCVQELMIVGNKPTSNPFQPYILYAPQSPIQMPSTISDCQPSSGLFQMEAIPDSHLDNMRTQHPPGSRFGFNLPGYPVVQHWGQDTLGRNYFNVNFMNKVRCPDGAGGPCVHATAAVLGGRLWPDPTPKFQTRLYP